MSLLDLLILCTSKPQKSLGSARSRQLPQQWSVLSRLYLKMQQTEQHRHRKTWFNVYIVSKVARCDYRVTTQMQDWKIRLNLTATLMLEVLNSYKLRHEFINIIKKKLEKPLHWKHWISWPRTVTWCLWKVAS